MMRSVVPALGMLLWLMPSAPAGPDLKARLDEAHQLTQQGRLDEAETLLRQLLQEHPREAGPLVELGRLRMGRGDLPGATAHLEKARSLSPDPAILSLLGQAYLLQDRREDARRTLEMAVSGNPRDVGSQFNLGRLLRLLGEPEPALATLERALELHPDTRMRQRIQSNLGRLHLESRRYERARALYQTLAEAEPEKPEWALGLSAAYEGLGDPRRALDLALRVAAHKPDLVDAQRRIGTLRRMLGDPAGALEACRKALQAAPDDGLSLALLATLLLDRGDSGQALETARKLLDKEPNHAQGHYLLGQALLAQGDRQGAEREFQTHRELASRRRAFQHTAASLGDD